MHALCRLRPRALSPPRLHPPHDNCADNLGAAITAFDVALHYIPTPLNLFMNTKLDEHKLMRVEAPQAKAGDSATFEARVDDAQPGASR